MKTLSIQIGNTDNKLTQKEWAFFILDIQKILSDTRYVGMQIHFAGGSSPEKVWQNYCFIVECDSSHIDDIRSKLSFVKTLYKQDSIALTVGKTEFV